MGGPRRGAHRGTSPFLRDFPPCQKLYFFFSFFWAQRARREGHFRNIPGRGRPLERNSEEHNPFIAPEEFLINRIVQRQRAAPPWVEVQGELEAAVTAFRTALRRSWVRRAVRILTPTHSHLSLRGPSPSLPDIRALRDREWETLEKAYHDTALADVNSLVRKYNALAPYAVRRAYYVREVELAKIYHESGEEILRERRGDPARAARRSCESGEEILRELEGWLRDSWAKAKDEASPGKDEAERLLMGASLAGNVRVLRLRDLFWQWIRQRI